MFGGHSCSCIASILLSGLGSVQRLRDSARLLYALRYGVSSSSQFTDYYIYILNIEFIDRYITYCMSQIAVKFIPLYESFNCFQLMWPWKTVPNSLVPTLCSFSSERCGGSSVYLKSRNSLQFRNETFYGSIYVPAHNCGKNNPIA